MSKAKIVRDNEGKFYGIKWLCPGCTWDDGAPQTKILPVDWMPPGESEQSPHVAGKPRWGFNGNFDAPTFTPSVLGSYESGPERTPYVCHSFVTDGRIQFLGDCTHALVNQTVDLPELEER